MDKLPLKTESGIILFDATNDLPTFSLLEVPALEPQNINDLTKITTSLFNNDKFYEFKTNLMKLEWDNL